MVVVKEKESQNAYHQKESTSTLNIMKWSTRIVEENKTNI